MIKVMGELPDGVLGFTASGQITGDDYESVLIPAVERSLKVHDKISLLYHLGDDFTGYDARAVWDDTKIGLKHPLSWQRIAVVSDVDWVRHSVRAFGFAMPCEVRVFDNDALDEARHWVCQR
jgi:hypothetical protein